MLVCQGASQLNGIGTLLQPHDQPILQGPHVRETRGEPFAGPSGTPLIAAEGDNAFAGLEELCAHGDEALEVLEKATEEVAEHVVEADIDAAIRKAFDYFPPDVRRQQLPEEDIRAPE